MLYNQKQREATFAKKMILLTIATLVILLMVVFSSCEKGSVVADLQTPEMAKKKVTKEAVAVSHESGSYEWDTRIYDCLTEETIHVVGTVTYNWKQSADKYLYNANFDGLNGIGETSGTVYHCSIHEGMTLNNGITTQRLKIMLTSDSGEDFTFSSLLRYYWDESFHLVVLIDKVSQTTCETY